MEATGPGSQAISGKDEGGSHFDEAAKVQAAQIKKKYTSKSVVVAIAAVDVDLLTLAADAFDKNKKVHAVFIRSDQDISVKFNTNTDDSITVDAGVPFTFSALEVTALFFSNASGINAAVRVILV